MNKSFIEIDDKLVAVTDENGNMDLRGNYKNIKDILSLENEISEIQESQGNLILKNDHLKSNKNKLIKDLAIIININAMSIVIPCVVVSAISHLISIPVALVSFFGCMVAANILVTLPLYISKNKKYKKAIASYEEKIKEGNDYLEKKMQELTNLKEEVNYKKIDEDKKDIYEYTYVKPTLEAEYRSDIKEENIKGFTKKRKK